MSPRIPWYVKFSAKLVLSRLPVSYHGWQRLGIFKHGRMKSSDYALDIFEEHLRLSGLASRSEPFRMLEMGPGDSVSSAVCAKAHGAASSVLVDVGNSVTREWPVYQALLDTVEQRLGWRPEGQPTDFDSLLAAVDGTYLTGGIDSLRSLPAESFDLIFSQAVLEHVRRDQFAETMAQFRRLLRPGGVSSHTIDLRDHLGNALHSLRFSPEFWESPRVAVAGFYTNRLRRQELLDHFRAAGLEAEVIRTVQWDRLPTPRAKLHPDYRDLPDDELRVHELQVALRRAD